MEQDTVLMIPTDSETRSCEPTGTATKLPIAQILSISPACEDHEKLHSILNDFNVATVGTLREAVTFLCLERVPVVFCECQLPDGTWKDILSYTAGLAEPPAIVVTSRLADDYLWAEVLNLGGYDVLAKPFSNIEVRCVVAGALRHKTSPLASALIASAAAGRHE
jgi:DNA-binding response OmpR family regulator